MLIVSKRLTVEQWDHNHWKELEKFFPDLMWFFKFRALEGKLLQFKGKQQKMNHLALVTHLLPLTMVDSAGLRLTLEGSGKLWRAQGGLWRAQGGLWRAPVGLKRAKSGLLRVQGGLWRVNGGHWRALEGKK